MTGGIRWKDGRYYGMKDLERLNSIIYVVAPTSLFYFLLSLPIAWILVVLLNLSLFSISYFVFLATLLRPFVVCKQTDDGLFDNYNIRRKFRNFAWSKLAVTVPDILDSLGRSRNFFYLQPHVQRTGMRKDRGENSIILKITFLQNGTY